MERLHVRRAPSSAFLFYACTLSVGLLSLIMLLAFPGTYYDHFLFMDKSDTFMDFFNPISHAWRNDPYTAVDRIYPAFCYIGYWLISRFIPLEYLLPDTGKAVRESQAGLFCLVVAFAATLLFLAAVLNRLFQGRKTEKLLFFVSVFFSAPFLNEYERANIILLAFACLCFFFAFKDSENKLFRELSLLLLCVASAIKLYPAIFGLLLLKERRWRDFLHCLLYGLILLFVPFAFFGGVRGFITWIASLHSGAANTLSVFQGVGYKVNFSNMVVTLYGLTHGGAINEGAIRSGGVIAIVLALLTLLAALVQRERWKQLMLITGILIGLPGFSFQYSMIFAVLPLLYFLNRHSSCR